MAIARCLCGKPRLVLLDEPTEGIQPSIIDEIVETLQRLRDNSGLTLILVEQNLDFIAALSHRILIIQKGKITSEAPSDLGGAGLVGECTESPPKPEFSGQITGREAMAVRRPTLDQLRSVAEELGMHMGEAELKSYDALMQGNYAAYDLVDAMPDYIPAVTYPRTPGYRPEGDENKHNAWYVKTTVKGASSGKLAGKTVALKDNVSLAGVPMMNGASTLEGYVPTTDATIVTRILDAGGTILGKTHCEYFCFSGGSHTNATGPVHNPHKMGYSSGGRLRAAAWWWRRVKPIWRSAATRVDRSVSLPRFAASTA